MTEHLRTIPPWWFEALWDGDAHCAFVLDHVRPELRVGDTLLMQDNYSRRRLRGEITHLFNGNDFADSNMVCVSFGRVAKLAEREA